MSPSLRLTVPQQDTRSVHVYMMYFIILKSDEFLLVCITFCSGESGSAMNYFQTRRTEAPEARSTISGNETEGDPLVQGAVRVAAELELRPLASTYVRKRGRNAQNVYVDMIAKAILTSPDRRLMLCDIYEYISKNHSGQINRADRQHVGGGDNGFSSDNGCGSAGRPSKIAGKQAWKNSVRHNLSSNGCFVKSEKSEFGKCSFWSIHPDCVEAFSKGDYRNRRPVKRQRNRRERKAEEVGSHAHAEADSSAESQVFSFFLPDSSTQESMFDYGRHADICSQPASRRFESGERNFLNGTSHAAYDCSNDHFRCNDYQSDLHAYHYYNSKNINGNYNGFTTSTDVINSITSGGDLNNTVNSNNNSNSNNSNACYYNYSSTWNNCNYSSNFNGSAGAIAWNEHSERQTLDHGSSFHPPHSVHQRGYSFPPSANDLQWRHAGPSSLTHDGNCYPHFYR